VKKVALFAFKGEPMCFGHVLLNALDMKARGFEVKLIIEGEATKQVSLLRNETKPFAQEYRMVREDGLIEGVCRACATKTGAINAAIEQGLQPLGEMNGHPAIGGYLEQGFEVLVF